MRSRRRKKQSSKDLKETSFRARSWARPAKDRDGRSLTRIRRSRRRERRRRRRIRRTRCKLSTSESRKRSARKGRPHRKDESHPRGRTKNGSMSLARSSVPSLGARACQRQHRSSRLPKKVHVGSHASAILQVRATGGRSRRLRRLMSERMAAGENTQPAQGVMRPCPKHGKYGERGPTIHGVPSSPVPPWVPFGLFQA